MTPAEKITDAIARLEQLKADSSKGPWRHEDYAYGHDVDNRGRVTSPDDGDAYNTADGVLPADADLIAVLHRTIDAQLAMLREAERTFTSRADQGVLNALIEHDCMHRWDGHLKLADAILGES